MNPTKAEKSLWNSMAEFGCIACHLDGIKNTHVSIHHIDGRTKPGAHSRVLPLCAPHHQTGDKDAPAIHPWSARFYAKYGSKDALLALINEKLKAL